MEAFDFPRAVALVAFFNLLLLLAWNFRQTIGQGRRQRFTDFRRMAAIPPIVALVFLALTAWKPTDPSSLQRIEAAAIGSLLAFALVWLLPRALWLRLPLLSLED